MREAFATIIAIVVVMVVVAMASMGLGVFNRAVVLETNKVFGPQEVEVERQITQESLAFINAMNGANLDDIMAWNSLQDEIAKSADAKVAAAYISQQQGIVEMICQRVGRMDADTVDANVRAFLVERGNNCR